MIIFGREPSPWTTSVFNMLEYSIRGVFNKWGNTVYPRWRKFHNPWTATIHQHMPLCTWIGYSNQYTADNRAFTVIRPPPQAAGHIAAGARRLAASARHLTSSRVVLRRCRAPPPLSPLPPRAPRCRRCPACARLAVFAVPVAIRDGDVSPAHRPAPPFLAVVVRRRVSSPQCRTEGDIGRMQ